jgi:hypothetical protein
MSRRYLSLLSALAVTAGWPLLPTVASADPLDPPPPQRPTIVVDTKHPPTSSNGPVNVTYQVTNGEDLDRTSVTATVKWAPATALTGAPVPDHATVGPTVLGCTQPAKVTGCSTPWTLAKGKYILNGTYQVLAHGQACTPPNIFNRISCTPADASDFVRVANPPVPTANVAAVAHTDPPAVSITWDPNPEPDVYAYAVFRLQDKKLVGEVGHCEVAAAGSNSCPTPPALLDTASGGGTFSYQVLAYRYGATYSAADAVSASSAPTKAVTVAGPPAPTTTTVVARPPATSATAALGAAAGLGAAGPGAAGTTFHRWPHPSALRPPPRARLPRPCQASSRGRPIRPSWVLPEGARRSSAPIISRLGTGVRSLPACCWWC